MAHCNITKINGFLLTIAAIRFKSFKVLSNRTEGNQKVMYVTTTEAVSYTHLTLPTKRIV